MSMPVKDRVEEKTTINDFMPIITGFMVGFIMYVLSVVMLPVITLTTINGFEVLLQPTVFMVSTFTTVIAMLMIKNKITSEIKSEDK